MVGRRVVRVRLLQQSEAEAHHRPALDLALDEGRVDGPPDVVHLDQPLHRHLSGLVVDLDLGHAGGVGDRRVRLDLDGTVVVADVGVRLERGSGTGDQLPVVPRRGCGDLRDADLPVRRSFRDDLSLDDVEVGGCDLELLRRDVQDPLACPLGSESHRIAADECAAGREAARAHRRRVGVRVVHRDPVVRDAEGVGGDLGVDGTRALPVVDRSGEDVDAAVGLELDPGLARIAVLVHAGRIFDRRDPTALVFRH